MVRSSALAISLLFSTIVSGSAISSGHVIHEKREVSAEGWMKGSRLHPDTKIPLRISLTQQDLERGHEYIMDVSHPSSPNYGKHWTAEEVATAFAPSNETFDKVQDWLASSNISVENILRTAGSLNIGLSIAEVERLLQTEYHSWTHAATGQKSAACDQYHVPNSLKEHIDFVTPGIALLAPTSDERKKKRSLSRRSDSMWEKPKKTGMPSWYHHGHANNSDLENCDQVITPACIKALYHVPPATMSNPTNNLGIFEDGDFYAQEDLNLFFANYTPYIPNGAYVRASTVDMERMFMTRAFHQEKSRTSPSDPCDLFHCMCSEPLTELRFSVQDFLRETCLLWGSQAHIQLSTLLMVGTLRYHSLTPEERALLTSKSRIP